MELKLLKIGQLVGHANHRLTETYEHWRQCVTPSLPPIRDHVTMHHRTSEEAVFMLRRAADELVALAWVLAIRLSDGDYPTVVKVDSIGSALAAEYGAVEPHRDFLIVLNDVTNAHKHSFINSDLTIVGADEPCVAALGLSRNRLSAERELYNVALADLTRDFGVFMADLFSSLRDLGRRLGATGAT